MFDCVWPSRTAVSHVTSSSLSPTSPSHHPSHVLPPAKPRLKPSLTALRQRHNPPRHPQLTPIRLLPRLFRHRIQLHLPLLSTHRPRRSRHHPSIHLPSDRQRNRRRPSPNNAQHPSSPGSHDRSTHSHHQRLLSCLSTGLFPDLVRRQQAKRSPLGD